MFRAGIEPLALHVVFPHAIAEVRAPVAAVKNQPAVPMLIKADGLSELVGQLDQGKCRSSSQKSEPLGIPGSLQPSPYSVSSAPPRLVIVVAVQFPGPLSRRFVSVSLFVHLMRCYGVDVAVFVGKSWRLGPRDLPREPPGRADA